MRALKWGGGRPEGEDEGRSDEGREGGSDDFSNCLAEKNSGNDFSCL